MTRDRAFNVIVKAAPVIVATLGLLSFFGVDHAGLGSVISQPLALLAVTLLGSLLTFMALVWRYREHDHRTRLEEDVERLESELGSVARIGELQTQAAKQVEQASETAAGVQAELEALRSELVEARPAGTASTGKRTSPSCAESSSCSTKRSTRWPVRASASKPNGRGRRRGSRHREGGIA